MQKAILSMIFALGFACAAQAAETHGAHEHGAAKMNISVEQDTVTIELDSPLDNILGFEHAPKTAKQRAAVQAMARRLHRADTLFVFTPAAKCALKTVTLESEKLDDALLQGKREKQKAAPAQGTSDAAPAEGDHDGHGDLEAVFTFACAAPRSLKSIDVLLFKEYKGMQEIEVQLVTPDKQVSAELTPKSTTLRW
ncbi:MAG: DUF2796 domain-containing protein [Desulfovibrio sp.]|jgi:hypothetical protein|nr:DUF2796 domain-containing protein [Desulfovibrio sp.]